MSLKERSSKDGNEVAQSRCSWCLAVADCKEGSWNHEGSATTVDHNGNNRVKVSP